jgi:hypothetical protein
LLPSSNGAASPWLSRQGHEPVRTAARAALEDGQNIGHYGGLVFAMVGHHFMDAGELQKHLVKNSGVTQEEARALCLQVEDCDYSPPRRERVASQSPRSVRAMIRLLP